jgi:hypothetical protein
MGSSAHYARRPFWTGREEKVLFHAVVSQNASNGKSVWPDFDMDGSVFGGGGSRAEQLGMAGNWVRPEPLGT